MSRKRKDKQYPKAPKEQPMTGFISCSGALYPSVFLGGLFNRLTAATIFDGATIFTFVFFGKY